jgi:hypothetical protein
MHWLLPLMAVLSPLLLQAQLMGLNSGTMHVSEGTRLTVEGPIIWQLASGATLTNDGTIEFGAEATLAEAPGSAIVGAGVETTSREFSSNVIGNEPAGLGLVLSSTSILGAITVIRGHAPFTLSNGSVGISRWYELITTAQPGGQLETTLRYDPAELNGLEASSLDLYTAVDPNDFWTPRSGEAFTDPWSITATVYWPWNHISAFQADATTGVTEVTDAGFRAWPTVTSGTVDLEALGKEGITSWELRDVSGRLHAGKRIGGSGANHGRIDLNGLPAGLYLLRVNDTVVIKLLKQ